MADVEVKHLESQEQSLKRYNDLMKAKEELAMRNQKRIDDEKADELKNSEFIKDIKKEWKR